MTRPQHMNGHAGSGSKPRHKLGVVSTLRWLDVLVTHSGRSANESRVNVLRVFSWRPRNSRMSPGTRCGVGACPRARGVALGISTSPCLRQRVRSTFHRPWHTFTQVLPIQIHVDGAEMFKAAEFMIFSVSSVLVDNKADVMDTKFALVKIAAQKLKPRRLLTNAMEKVAAWFAWQFEVCQTGVIPTHGFYGDELDTTLRGALMDGDYTAAFAFFKSDGKARCESHSFSNNFSTTHCCDGCFATQPVPTVLKKVRLKALLYTDTSPNAGWRHTVFDHETYMEHTLYRSPWHVVPGWRKELVIHDWMHVGPLGILRDFDGSLAFDLAHRGELGGALYAGIDPNDKNTLLKRLWFNFRQWCTHTGRSAPRGGLLSLVSLGRGKSSLEYPELSSAVKAVAVKDFAVYLAKVVAELPQIDDYTRIRAACSWAMAEFIHVTDNAGLILTNEQVGRLSFAAQTYVKFYSVLATMAADDVLYMWKVRPKFHYFTHMCEFAVSSKLNPTLIACWNEESYLGRVKRLSTKCSACTMLTTSLLRYFIFLGLRWESRNKCAVQMLVRSKCRSPVGMHGNLAPHNSPPYTMPRGMTFVCYRCCAAWGDATQHPWQASKRHASSLLKLAAAYFSIKNRLCYKYPCSGGAIFCLIIHVRTAKWRPCKHHGE